MPGQIAPVEALLARAHSLFPSVAGDKVAAGVAYAIEVKLFGEGQPILLEALGVGSRMTAFLNAAVDGPVQCVQ